MTNNILLSKCSMSSVIPMTTLLPWVIYKHVNFNASEVVKIKSSNMVVNTSSELVYQRINYYFNLF